ncbi:hypothetical protein RJ640_027408 [Escallonia rubra]|uniref:RNA-dependent RNA polymerase n=1 Tax=Escallonia rubra TaxID=112253 RepID=A0AA88RGQ3_9ASTE|nr:hypothetical protein RJ640_027408 [Escallonia rubra]
MADPSTQVPLPYSVEKLLHKISVDQAQSTADPYARRLLASLGEEMSLDILRRIALITAPDDASYKSPIPQHRIQNPCSTPERATARAISPQLSVLSELEFRKAFLILSYIGRKKLEDVMSVDEILKLKNLDLPMRLFESTLWSDYGNKLCDDEKDRAKVNTMLILALFKLRSAEHAIFKDGGKEDKKKMKTSSGVRCYFVRMESLAPFDEREPYILSDKTVHEARCLFMHVHMVASMAKYAARFSLILSKTIKLPIDLASVHIERIEDIPCRDENDCVVYDDGEPRIHTDGTGYISEDLAVKCPKEFCNAKDRTLKRILDQVGGTEARRREPPLLIQCRIFNNGCAVKGTLLVNRKLPPKTIQVRPSMIKVETDSSYRDEQSFNSLEVVAISHKPRKATLSKNLIALLCFGGVPKDFFLELLANAIEDARSVFSDKRAAVRVALNHGAIDDDFTTTRMILAGIPLDEPGLRYRLSHLAKEERKGLKGGRLPISESFYLMGTTDPTGVLNSDEVCVILENGQISGEVLVYRNPGLHFGDIHVLNAVYVKDLENFVGNAKFAIFFSTKGRRSVASEIANGDFDGDMYWVSRNPQLLTSFKPSKPWERIYSTPNACSKKPSEFSSKEELEREYFQLFLSTCKQRNVMGVAADSWLAFMDRLLILGDCRTDEKEQMKKTMLNLVDIYYDALDASKSGKKVEVPDELRAEMFPHYMERVSKFQSTSVLGIIYDTVQLGQPEESSIEDFTKLSCFDVEIPDDVKLRWKEGYDDYRKEMQEALNSGNEPNHAADEVTKKYKKMLYGALELEESERKMEDIYNDALAIYHATYDHAKSKGEVKKCNFAWKVAGPALCKFYTMKQSEKSIACSPSVLRELLE